MQWTLPVWPFHCNGGTGHVDNFPCRTLMPLENRVPNIVDKGDCEGRKGPVEI